MVKDSLYLSPLYIIFRILPDSGLISPLADTADGLQDGKTKKYEDYWDRQLTGSKTKELFYASGTSTITSTGKFTLSRKGNAIAIEGSVSHRWWDTNHCL